MITSIKKAASILKVLSNYYPESISLEQISKETNISKSTCVQMLNTLISESLAERTQYSKYSLGAGCFYLTRSGRFDKKNVEICRPVLHWLRDKTGETTLLSQIRSNQRYVIDYAIGDYALRNSGDDIILGDIYGTATGKMIAAHLLDDELYNLVERHGLPSSENWQEFDDINSLKKALEKIRQSPWIASKYGVCTGYAAPVFQNGKIFGSVGFTVISSKNTDKSKEAYNVKHLVAAAKEMTRRLNF